ncbi:hypothetical protein IFT48_03555 [Pseudomonas fluorescens]|uniref:hypothetical protein n=1 Tax=Pseudomonas fluorescens TaxID=294 RepID=UPI001930C3B7|nr:hypothetical protein [Pseudomonas fluorescens]MBD8089045.1 hypothetical protein [Pseudomonas fluorescens]
MNTAISSEALPVLNHENRRAPRPVELPDTLEACAALMEELSSSSISLESALGEAKSKAYNDKVYADPKWFHRASTKLKYVKRHRQMLQDHIGRLRKAQKAQNVVQNTQAYQATRQQNVLRQDAARVYDRLLLDVIKENTTREDFMAWVALAQERMAQTVTIVD